MTISLAILLLILGLLTEFYSGLVTSLSGLGGGIVLIPFLTDIMKVPIKKASSISIGVIMLLAVSVSISYLFVNESESLIERLPIQIGYISLILSTPILIGIFIASSFGVKVAQKTSPRVLRTIFGIIVTLLCIKMTIGLWSN